MWLWLAESDTKFATLLRAGLFVALGVSIMVLADTLFREGTVKHVFMELGVAIIVASIAVRAIDLRGNDRLIKKLVSELTAMAETQHTKLAEIGEAHFEKMAAMVNRSSREALPEVLQEVFKDRDPRLYANTIAIIDSFEKMGSTQSWTDRVALRFVGDLFQYVSDNATNLAKATAPGGAYDITLPRSASQLADTILAGQMDQLVEGDSYIVVSDLSSWRDGLSEFFSATVRALEKRVKVRRLVCPFDEDRLLKQTEIDEFFQRHWDEKIFRDWLDADGLPMYELAILTRREVVSNKNLSIEHVGVFHHAKEIACFEPRQSDLSRMTFSTEDKLDKKVLEKLWPKAHANYRVEGKEVHLVSRREIVKTLGKDWWK